ncbi:MAG TPA: hypothetical protein VGF94_29700 [Kofleriaceae bacterium]|jgi:hypothetical protein
MKHAIWCIALVLACGKSGEEQAKEDMAQRAAQEAKLQGDTQPAPPPKVVQGAPDPLVAPKPPAPPTPEPTTPAELDKAFKQSMIDGRDKDVLHYCDMLKLGDTSNPQSLMGCTLAACRTNDADTAKKYAASLPMSKDGKALLVQAKKVCLANNVPL